MVRRRVSTGHKPGPIRVAAAPSTKTTKAPPTATPVNKIIWHVYETLIRPKPGGLPQGYSKDDLFEWFNAPDDTRIPGGPGKMGHRGYQARVEHRPQKGSQSLRTIPSNQRGYRGVHRAFDANAS